MRLQNKEARLAARYVPKGSAAVRCKISGAVVYLFERAGKPCAIGYVGSSSKPAIHYSYGNPERRAASVKNFLEACIASEKRKADRLADKRAAMAKPHGVKVGDVFSASWGYDQTNVDYYEVVELVGKRGVKIREIGSESVSVGDMQGECVPLPGSFKSEPVLKKIGENDSIKVRDWGVWARKMQPIVVAGTPVGYRSAHWTAYA